MLKCVDIVFRCIPNSDIVMIEVRHLYKSFGDKEVLKDINFKFEDGKTNLIIGQSGSGKTVLMKISLACSIQHLARCSTMVVTS